MLFIMAMDFIQQIIRIKKMNENAIQILETLKSWHCPNHLKNDKSVDDLIVNIYNEAMDDIESIINIMIDNNPQYTIALTSLKKTLYPGSKLDEFTK